MCKEETTTIDFEPFDLNNCGCGGSAKLTTVNVIDGLNSRTYSYCSCKECNATSHFNVDIDKAKENWNKANPNQPRTIWYGYPMPTQNYTINCDLSKITNSKENYFDCPHCNGRITKHFVRTKKMYLVDYLCKIPVQEIEYTKETEEQKLDEFLENHTSTSFAIFYKKKEANRFYKKQKNIIKKANETSKEFYRTCSISSSLRSMQGE